MTDQTAVIRDEFAFCTPGAKDGILTIRGLGDETLLAAARDQASAAHAGLMRWMGPSTNPFWITGRCAETAYERGLIDEVELGFITR